MTYSWPLPGRWRVRVCLSVECGGWLCRVYTRLGGCLTADWRFVVLVYLVHGVSECHTICRGGLIQLCCTGAVGCGGVCGAARS